MKKTILLIGFMTLAVFLNAQQTKVFFGLGGTYNSFQDARFSDVQFSKATIIPELGFSMVSRKNYWYAGANFSFFSYSFPNYDTITYTNLSYNVSFGYLRNLRTSFFLGFNWDLLDFYKRQTEFLFNGSDAYKLSSDLFVSGKYLWSISEDFRLDLGIDYGLLSFINTEPSFSANYQQNIIDNGEVTFIDSDTKSPFKLSNMEAKAFWEQFYLRTLAELHYKRRLSLNYSWDMRTYSDTRGYPVTNARHNLTLRLNFISHKKV